MKSPIVVLLLAVAAGAQQAPEGPPSPRQESPPVNLKLLDPAELRPTMRTIRSALGVDCQFCHVEGNMASDEKPNKLTARRMIEMTRDINARFRDGKTHVTCYTCHRGASEPLTVPPAPAQAAPPAPPAGAAPGS